MTKERLNHLCRLSFEALQRDTEEGNLAKINISLACNQAVSYILDLGQKVYSKMTSCQVEMFIHGVEFALRQKRYIRNDICPLTQKELKSTFEDMLRYEKESSKYALTTLPTHKRLVAPT